MSVNQRAKNQARIQSAREIVRSSKNVPCADCGVRYPHYVMDFDHVRGEKKFNMAIAGRGTVSLGALRLEIVKCDVVCANCHRIRTFERANATQEVA